MFLFDPFYLLVALSPIWNGQIVSWNHRSSRKNLFRLLYSRLSPISFSYKQLKRSVDIEYLCLFFNVSLAQTVGICAVILYRSPLKAPSFPKNTFIELMELATKSVSLSSTFGVSMGSPLGPILVDILIDFQENYFLKVVEIV